MRTLLLALVLIACGSKKDNDKKPATGSGSGSAAPAQMRIFPDEEIAANEKALMERIAKNGKRTCPRPPVRGAAQPGSSAPLVAKLVEPTDTLGECMNKVGALTSGGKKLEELIAAKDKELVALDDACGRELVEYVGRIAAHESGCSPFQAGVQVEPEKMLPAMRAAHMIGLRMRLMAERGDGAGALWLGAESIRAFQDLMRGQVSLIAMSMATASINVVLTHVEHVLTTAKLNAAQAKALAAGYDVLIASEPSFGGVLRGEYDYMALHMGLPPLHPPGWVPPGGANMISKSYATRGPEERPPVDARDEGGFVLAAASSRDVDACPEGASHATCWKGLNELAQQSAAGGAGGADNAGDPLQLVPKLLGEAGTPPTPEAREVVRREIHKRVVAEFARVSRPTLAGYVATRARTFARLVGARIALEVRRLGTCPKPAQLEPLLAPAALGDTVGVTSDAGALQIAAPDWAKDEDSVFTARCK